MGKTVTSLLIVAAAIAVNVIPGVGQAISAGLLSAGLGAAAAAGITAAITTAITGLAVGAIGALLTGTPKFSVPETQRTALKTSTPPRVSAYGQSRLYGAYMLFDNSLFSEDGNSAVFAPYGVDVFAVHDGPIDAITQRYLGDKKITKTGRVVNPLPNGQYYDERSPNVPTVNWYETLGETPGLAGSFSLLNTAVPHLWGPNHRADGVVVLAIIWRAVRNDKFSEVFPDGTPPASIAARWQRVYDPRDSSQSPVNPDTWKWKDNAALALLHYRLVREKARREPGRVLPSAAALSDAWATFFAPTVDMWKAAADVCDEPVPLRGGGTEPRYRTSLMHKHTDMHKDVIEGLTACFDGWTAPRADGALTVFAGKYKAPTVSINADHIVSYSWQHGVVDEEAINELKLTYISAEHDYTTVEADAWTDLDDISERGAIRSQGVDFMVPSHGQARRLAKRFISRVMASSRGVVTTNVAGRVIRGHRYINLKIEEAGAVFFEGVAEITSLTRNVSTGGLTFSWVAVSPSIDAWNAATEEGSPAVLKNRTALLAGPTPQVTSASLVFDAATQEGTGVRLLITASGPSQSDVTWYARWRKEGDPIWNEQQFNDLDPGAEVSLLTGFVPVNVDLEVAVAYESSLALSPWSASFDVGTEVAGTPPDETRVPTFIDWTSRIAFSSEAIPRASSYRWQLLDAAGVEVLATVTTRDPTLAYTSEQATIDGTPRRAYRVRVAGANSAGVGPYGASVPIAKPAPPAPTAVAFADGAYSTTITFTGSEGARGYLVAFATEQNFDPLTKGQSFSIGNSPGYSQNLAAATYYGKVAAYDEWSLRPDLVNFSAEDAFTIATGTGTPPGGGGGGGWQGGGGGGTRYYIEPRAEN